jgi:uncharacterized membrane protein YkgB
MSQTLSGQATYAANKAEQSQGLIAKSALTKLALWVSDHNIPFLISSVGLIVMLLWAGSYKMTAPGAEGIIPLVSNSPLTSWHFKLFGPYIGADLIGLTEITAATLMIVGYFWPKAGILGGLIACAMFFTTSTMIITTPGALTNVHGMRYMSFLGLFLFKDVVALGVSSFLVSYFGKKAILSENKS